VARRVGKNIGCDDCRAFRVHWHPERLVGKAAPSGRKKPAVVGVQFTGDLFDPHRRMADVFDALNAMRDAPQHTHVLLTQQYDRAEGLLLEWLRREMDRACAFVRDRWYVGTTCHNQEEYNRAALAFASGPWQWWVSAEPLRFAIVPGEWRPPTGIIIGHDNQVAASCGLGAVAETVWGFAGRSAVYVKQVWMLQCPRCRAIFSSGDVGPAMQCACGTPASRFEWLLATKPNALPAKLRLRQLPWTLTMGDGHGLTTEGTDGAESGEKA
jgi:hypothetical protein